jgi:hypothetical protein
MKHARILALTALAALAALALAASSASAETGAKICSLSGANGACNNAAHGQLYKGEIDASLEAGTSATLTATDTSGNSVKTITCTVSTVKGQVTDPANGTGTITSQTFDKCSAAGCETVTASTPRTGGSFPWPATVTTEIAKTENTNGIMHITQEAGKTNGPSGKFSCRVFGIHFTCEYEATNATVTITGGNPATVKATNVPLTLKSGSEASCGQTGHWSGAYWVTTPSSLYIE